VKLRGVGILPAGLLAVLSAGTIRAQDASMGPLKVGDTELVDIHSPHPYLAGLGGTRIIWSETLQKEGATFVRVHFTAGTLLDPGGEDSLLVRDQDGQVVETYRAGGAANRWTLITEGERLTVELLASPNGGGQGVEIDQVAWGTQPLFPEPQIATAGTTYYNICDAEVEARIRLADPVASIFWDDECGGMFRCSAWLFSPAGHLMTNGHCANSQIEADSLECWFNYVDTACDLPTRVNTDRFRGAYNPADETGIKFVQRNCDLDYSVMIVNDPTKGNPAEVYGYLDIALGRPATGTGLWLPQHPFGSRKQIAENCQVINNFVRGFNGCIDPSNDCNNDGFFVGRSDLLVDCPIDHGSSGSPVINAATNQVVAIIHAGDPNDPLRNFGVRMTEIVQDVPNVPVVLELTGPATVQEGQSAQFTATLSRLFGPDRNVNPTMWFVGSASAGTIDDNGLFTAEMVTADRRTTISGQYTDMGTTVDDGVNITILDVPEVITIVGTVPPEGAVDARQTSELDGSNPNGWQSIEVLFSGKALAVQPADFGVSQVGGTGPPPSVDAVQILEPTRVEVQLSDPIEAGARTTVMHKDSGTSVELGYLPGDINGDGSSEPQDAEALIGALDGIATGIGNPLPDWSSDIDRSGVVNTLDLLREIDLLNGANDLHAWNGASLP